MSENRLLPSPTRDAVMGMRDLAQFGYAIHEDYLTANQVAAMRERLAEQAELELEHGLAAFGLNGHRDVRIGAPPDGALPAYQQIAFLPAKGREFLSLLTHDLTHAYLAHVLRGVPYALATMTGLVVRNGAEEMVTHIDQQPIPFPTDRPTGLNIMYCLVDFEEDMGATRLAPGSHLGPPPTIEFDAEGRPLPPSLPMFPAVAKAGSAILFESRVWHCQGRATSEKVRYSVVTNFVMHFLKPQENYPASLPDNVYARLSDDEKRMLGFEAVFSYGGKIAPRSADDPRQNTNDPRPFVPELRRSR